MDINLTPNVVKLLRAFLEDPEERHFGTQLTKKAGISPGSLYPALRRLEGAGFITGEEEQIDPKAEGRPARRYYTLTGEGAQEAHLLLAEFSASVAPPARSPGWLTSPAPKGA
ncbi:PadR family transcriptional regulator [Streptomyces sp. NPDC007148]|uniref:PadR family transcriptional regulator n=1 Tax=Streptomyces sp. NPDC007148 TaxID=3364775 RepID=UPI00369892E9